MTLHPPRGKAPDCTIRDGGLINNHDFSDEFVREAWRQSEDRDNQGEFYERLLEGIE